MDHDVDIGAAHRQHGVFDLVCDVRDDLHRVAQIVAATFLAITDEYTLPVVTFASPERSTLRKALVVTDVKIGLGAVLGDEDLAVLETGSWCPDRH